MTILQDVKAAAAADEKPKDGDGKAPAAAEGAAAPEQNEEQIPDGELRAMASARGWVPKKYFKGDPEKWISHDKFLERAEHETPLLKADKRRLQKELAEMHGLVKRLVANTQAEKKRAAEEAIAKYVAEKREAVKEGDVDKVEAIDKKIDKVKEKAADEVEASAKSEIPPEMAEWVEKNPWFKASRGMRNYAEAAWKQLQYDDDFDEMSLTEQLDAVRKEVKKRYPEKFGNPARREAPAVEGGNGGPRNGAGAKTYADLPAEAKAICDDLVKQGVLKKDQYVKDYFRD